MDFDAIVIGAGVAGLYQVHSLRKLGLSVRAFDAAPEVGGTWYWNRYPGCRFDSESYTYGYSFSPELLEEWDWSELFAGQPETYRYLQHVADRFDLRKDIQLDTRIVSARYDAQANLWTIETADGERFSARFLITAVGILSAPIMPDFPGQDSFGGASFHSSFWPEGLDLAGKRVAVFGTGATGVQVIQSIAPIVGQLTVYQRSGNWTKPLRNRPIDKQEMDEIRSRYPEIFARCRATAAAFVHDWTPQNTFDASDDEREAFFEQRYAEPGFGFWLGGYQDLAVNPAAAKAAQDFLVRKLRQRVNDPAVAELLCPTDHLFGSKRVPLETRHYEAYNQDNVELVDLKSEPVERITPAGVVTGGVERAFDVIIYATGFDAFRGALDRIEFHGLDGTLREKWAPGIATYMGLQYRGFPNLLTILGPQNGGSYCNIPRCLEQNVEFIAALIEHMRENGLDRVEPVVEAERAWTQSAHDLSQGLLAMEIDSYMNSANTQHSGAPKRREILVNAGGQNAFRQFCDDMVAEGYRGLELSRVD